MKKPLLSSLARTTRWLVSATLLAASNGTAHGAAEADLLVAYDQTHASTVGGGDNAQVLAANAVAGSNLINQRAGTGSQMRIVGFHQGATWNYQASSNGGFLQWLDPANAQHSRMDDVLAAANSRGADLVAYICESNADGAAAVAGQPGRFAAYDSGQFWSTVVAHETGGHNFGCDHRDGHANPKTVMLHNYCGGGAQGWYSNSNIWLSGVRLTGGDSCLGAGPNGGDNSLVISNAAQGTADRMARVVVAPTLANVVRRWSFNQPAGSAPSGTNFTDLAGGGTAATILGNGATFTGTGVLLPGGAAGSNPAYVKLPAGAISALTNATIEIWAKTISAQSWARVADFNNGTSNYLTLTAAVGTDLDSQRFESKVAGTTVSLDSGLPTAEGVLHHYAITYTSTGASTGRWTWYRDGDMVAFLDVAYPLSAFPDVNNWLGRSAYAGDAFANCEYQEVRVSNVALSRDQILANYCLGPNRQSADVALTADDPFGASSFASAGRWSDGLAPSAAKSYETFNLRLRTPADATSRTFAGQSLKLSGGSLTWKGTGSSSTTINNLTLTHQSEVLHSGSGTWTLAGNLNVNSDEASVRASGGPINVSANLGGNGTLNVIDETVTLSGTNSAFAGKIAVGDGRWGTVAINAEARLGPNPAALTLDALSFNRGTLTTSTDFAIDDSNRGILLGINGGTFNVTSGNLTITSPLYSPDLGSSVIAGALRKTGAGTLILNSPNNGFEGAVYLGGGGTANDGILRVMNPQVLANARMIEFTNNNAGSATLQLDGTSGTIGLTRVTLSGRTGTSPGIQNLTGTNNVGGLTLNTGGANHIVQSDSGLLNFTGSIYSGVTGTRTVTFQGNGDITTSSTISELTADLLNVVKNGNGTLTLAGACGHDGSTTLNGGTLRLNGTLQTATSTMTTATGTTFAGTGTSAAITTLNGIHAPGNATNSTGTQTFTGTLAYKGTSKLNWTLANNGTTASKVAAQGVTVTAGAAVNLVFNGPASAVNFTNSYWTQPRSWTVLTSTSMSGQFTLGTVSADAGGRPASAYGTFTLQQSATGVTLSFFPLNVAPPAAPTSVAAAGSPGSVTLGWVAPSGATSYNVKRSLSSGGPYDTIATGVVTTSYTDSSATNGTTYYYVITAVSQFGEGNESVEVIGKPHLPTTILKANNALALNQADSWTDSLLPSAYDIAKWSGLTGANSVALGVNTSLKGIMIETTGGAVTVTTGSTLTLGTAGIDMSIANQNLTVASGLTLGVGSQTWNVATGKTLAVTGTFTRSVGSSLVIDKSVNTGTVTASPALTNGLIPWAAMKSTGTAANASANGFTFATVTSGNLVPFTTATSVANYGYASSVTANYDVNYTGNQTFGSTRDANTVRHIGGGASLTTNSTQTWGFNGLMNAGTGSLSFGGGNTLNIKAGVGTASELVLTAATGALTINGPIINNGATSSSVVVNALGTNTVVLGGASTYSGGTILTTGELGLGADSTVVSGTVTSGPLGTGTLTIYGGELNPRFGGTQTIANAMAVKGDFTLNGRVNTTAIVLAGNLDLTSDSRTITVPSASSGATTISGIVSNGAFTKAGTGLLTFSGANTYTGGTTLSAGTLKIGNLASLGATTGSLTVNEGTLDLNALSPTVGTLSGTGGTISNLTNGTSVLITNSPASSTFAGALQNGAAGQVLALTKQGVGTLTLSGSSNYSGATTVNAGTLMVTGALTGNSPVTVANGATLAGTGTSSGTATVATGGALAPGTATTGGTLTLTGALTLTNGSVMNLKLATPASSSKVALGGTLNASGVTTIHLAAISGFGPGIYPLITGGGALNASNFVLGSTPPGYSYALTANSGTLSLTVAEALDPPNGLAASGISSGVSLTWTALPGADSYIVKRSTTSGSGFAIIASGVTTPNYDNTGLTPGTDYYYTVAAVNLAGTSDDSVEVNATALTALEAWRKQKFGTPDNVDSAANEGDPDSDGLWNLLEYAIGSDPSAPSPGAASQSAINSGKLTLSFTRNTAATDVTLSVVASDSPTGPWTEIARSTNGGAFTSTLNGTPSGATVSETGSGALRNVQVSDVAPTSANPKRFLRLEARP